MKQSFSTSEVARYCHVTADTIRKWAEAGRIVVFKTPGGHRRIRREDLMSFLRENQMPLHPELLGPVTSILIVSADIGLVKTVQDAVESANGGVQVLVARDSFDAGRQTAVFSPRVVVVDLEVGSEQGAPLPATVSTQAEQLCERISSSPELAHACLIAVTRADDGQLATRALKQGASTCLRKPLDVATLQETLALAGLDLL
jgi:excisionase family DNA binding protein